MTMIEKMARAMSDGNWSAASFCETPNGETPEEYREYWLEKARAALEALLDPSEAMVERGDYGPVEGPVCHEGPSAYQVWQAMIRAALEEK